MVQGPGKRKRDVPTPISERETLSQPASSGHRGLGRAWRELSCVPAPPWGLCGRRVTAYSLNTHMSLWTTRLAGGLPSQKLGTTGRGKFRVVLRARH